MTLVAGRYRLEGLLGQGGGARAFAMCDLWDGERRVAVKVLRAEEEAADLAREFALLYRLRHPHVARALALGRLTAPFTEAGASVGALYFVQELCPGVPGSRFLAARDPAAAVVVAAQAAAALAALHAAGIAHGDVKPDNLVIDGGGASDAHARLVDFGLAHRGRATSGGTLGFLAPEALTGRGGPPADIYALGATLATLLGGTPPPARGPVTSPVHGELVRALTEPDPSRRLDAPGAFAALLELVPAALRGRLDALRDGSSPGSALIGRERAVAALEAALAPPIVSTRVVRLLGPAGMGRTAVLEEAVVRGAWRGLVAPGSVRAAGSGALEVVESALRELGAELEAREEPAAPAGDASELAAARWQRFSRLAAALGAASRRAPVLLAFDDVPRGSPLDELAEFLARLGESGPRVVWVQSGIGAGAEAVLGALEVEGVRRLVVEARPLRPADAAVAPELHAASGGVPASVVAALRLFPGDRLSAAARAGELTAALEASAATRLEALLEPARRVVLALTAFASPVPARLLEPLFEGSLAAASLEAEAAGLVVSRPSPAGVALAVAGEGLRQALAPRAGRALLEALLGLLEEDAHGWPAAVGMLWRRLGEVEKARAPLERAARDAAASLRIGEALSLYDLLLDDPGLPPVPRREAQVASARLLAASGWLEQARERFHAARAHPEHRLGEAEVLVSLGRYAEAVASLEGAGPDGEDAVAVRALRARAALLGADYTRAEAEAVAGLAHAAGHPRRAELEMTRGLVAFYRGELSDARALLTAALATAREGGSPRVVDRCRANLALVLHKALDYVGAERLYAEGLEAARTRRDLPAQAQRLGNLASLQQERGAVAQALASYREAYELARLIDDKRSLVRIGLNRANLCAWLGDLDQARSLCAAARQSAAALELASEGAYLALLSAELEGARGELERAHQRLAEARVAFAAAGNEAQLVEARSVEAELALAARDLAAAEAGALEAAALAEEAGRTRLAAQALVWATLAALEHQDGKAEATARRLATHAEKLADPELAWIAHAALSRELSRLGRSADAELELARAREHAAELRARLGPRLERPFGELWYRRELWGFVGRAAASTVTTSLRDVDRLLAINRELAQDHDPERLLERIIDAAIALSGAERGFVVLAPEPGEGGALVIRAARNLDQGAPAQGELELSRSIALEVIATGLPVSTVDAQGDERFRSQLSVHRLALRSVLCLPLRSRAGVLGALYLDHRHRVDAFSDADVALLTAFGDQAAIALANARRVSELAARTQDLERSREAIEELNARLAKELEVSAAELEVVRARAPREDGEAGRHGLIGVSAGMREVYRVLERVADKDVPVAILGESGTGKELVARAIHAASPRRGGPFVSVNCGAIPRELLESELFGHERGAFTGAVRAKPGLFEVAARGTLLLDEIGDMPLEMQVKLLRVLQQKELRRVGGTVDFPTDVRVLSASNRDLAALVREGRFREDLWFRLDVVELHVPPLRARREDLPLLVEHFVRRFGGETPPRVQRDALAALFDYDWPGNVRELENELQRALALADGAVTALDLSARVREAAAGARPAAGRKGSLRDALDRYERELLTRALEQHEGKVTAVARALGLTRAGLYKKLHRHGLPVTRR